MKDEYRANFIVNQLGVLIAGLIVYKLKTNDLQRLFWVAGFAGGFTTFSTFAVLNIQRDSYASLIFSTASFLVSITIIRFLGKVNIK